MNKPSDELLEAYLGALSSDPDAPVPAGLEPRLAEFARALALSQRQGARRRVWQKALAMHSSNKPGENTITNEDRTPASALEPVARQRVRNRRFSVLLSVAALIIVACGLLLWLRRPNSASPAHVIALQQTSTAIATLVPPIFQSDPAPNSAITIQIPVGADLAFAHLTISNPGGAPLSLEAPDLGPAPLTAIKITPDTPQTVAPSSGTANAIQVTLTCTGSAMVANDVASNVTLSYSTNDPTQATVSYRIECINLNRVPPTPILPAQTATPAPTATPATHFMAVTPPSMPTAHTSPQLIAPDNAQRLKIDGIPGKGLLCQIAWSPDRTLVAVASSSGVWLYKANALDKAGQLLQGYPGEMTQVVFSPKGDLLASSNDMTVVVWGVKGGSAKAVLPGLAGGHVLAFSPDQSLLATANGHTISLWDLASGEQRLAVANTLIKPSGSSDGSAIHPTEGVIHSLAFSPRGKLLASGDSDNEIRLWDVQTGAFQGEFIPTLPNGLYHAGNGILSLAFSPDGKLLVSGGGDNYVRIWNVDGKFERTSRADEVYGVAEVSFSADGNAVAYRGDSAWFWQFESGKEAAFLPKDAYWEDLVFNLDDSPLALGTKDGHWVMWTPMLGQYKPVLDGFNLSDGVCCDMGLNMALSLDGKRLSIVGYKTYALLNLATGEQRNICRAENCGGSIALSPDGQHMLIWEDPMYGQGTKLGLWDIDTGQIKDLQVPGNMTLGVGLGVAFSPDGKLMATIGADSYNGDRDYHELILWDVQSAKPISALMQKQTGALLRWMQFSADSKQLYYVSQSGITIWDAQNLRILKTIPLTGLGVPVTSQDEYVGVCGLQLSPDNKQVAYTLFPSGSEGPSITIIDVASGSVLKTLTPSELPDRSNFPPIQLTLCKFAFSPNGQTVAAPYADTIQLWQIPGGQLSVLKPGNAAIGGLAFSPDGKLLTATYATFQWAKATESNSAIPLWDAATGKALAALQGHSAEVNSVQFSPDGTTLASADGNGVIYLWHVTD